jgi:uncharacterized protein (TIGR03118 family)
MAFKTTIAALGLLAASMPAWAGSFTQTNLVSDGAVAAAVTDPNLKNPWGISYNPTGPFWVSDNATGLTTLYNGSGAIQGLVVSIPAAGGSTATGSPTGQVFNPGSQFVVSAGGKSGAAAFLFATEDGTISGWNFGVDAGKAVVAVDRSAVGAGAVYKGIALYTAGTGKTYLLATDFRNAKVDVFDGTFQLLWSFRDRTLPGDYAPYNIAAIDHKIYVTYAKQDAAKHDSISGNGLGAVEEVGLKGKVFAKSVHGALNAPWGLAVAPAGYGRYGKHLLVGNFGDGHITGFSANLTPVGQLQDAQGYPIAIEGLWGLIVGNGGSAGSASDLYFSAGPNGEADGLLGSLSYAP